jgi:deoxyribodipyrimidine photo-lyase
MHDSDQPDQISIVWFRQDLRVNDNQALIHAAQNGRVLPIYILDDQNAAADQLGAASRVWLLRALANTA